MTVPIQLEHGQDVAVLDVGCDNPVPGAVEAVSVGLEAVAQRQAPAP